MHFLSNEILSHFLTLLEINPMENINLQNRLRGSNCTPQCSVCVRGGRGLAAEGRDGPGIHEAENLAWECSSQPRIPESETDALGRNWEWLPWEPLWGQGSPVFRKDKAGCRNREKGLMWQKGVGERWKTRYVRQGWASLGEMHKARCRNTQCGGFGSQLVGFPFNSLFPSSFYLLTKLNCLICSLPLLECKLHKAWIFCLFPPLIYLQLQYQQVPKKYLLNEWTDSITYCGLKGGKKILFFCLIVESFNFAVETNWRATKYSFPWWMDLESKSVWGWWMELTVKKGKAVVLGGNTTSRTSHQYFCP